MRSSGGGRQQVTHNARDDQSPVYSPRGGQIAYVEDVDRTDARDYEIIRIKSNGHDRHRVTQSAAIDRFSGDIDWGARAIRP